LRDVDEWLEHYRRFWDASLERLEKFLVAEKADAGKPSRKKAAK
jgi:hypothetical protein